MEKGAILSGCATYRYALWRRWRADRPAVLFILLNPSTADADLEDPTLRRCLQFAKQWKFGAVYLGNRFAYRTPDPKTLWTAKEPVGPLNDFYLQWMSRQVTNIVYGWGHQLGGPTDRIRAFGKGSYIDRAKDGSPKHPLYLKSKLSLRPWSNG